MLKPVCTLLLFAFAVTLIAESCPADAARKASANALARQNQLLAAHTPEMTEDVPDPVKPLLHNFKQAILEAVDTVLRCNNPEPSRLQADFAALFKANRPPRTFTEQRAMSSGDDATGEFGGDLEVTVEPVPGQHQLYAIKLDYSISCGADYILLLYRRTQTGYRRELVYQSSDFNSIGDAIGDFVDFAVVPSASTHPYLIAAAHGTAWCQSIHSEFHVDLLAPASGGQPQKTLAHEAAGYLRDDYALTLRSTKNGFEIRADVSSIDQDIFSRPAVFRFRTTSAHLERIQPVALNARDFVDEWLQTEWPKPRWLTAGANDPLAAYRTRITDPRDPLAVFSPDQIFLGPVRACSRDKTHFQVEFDLQKFKISPDASPRRPVTPRQALFAQVHLEGSSCLMLAITPSADPDCTGPDLMKPAHPSQ